MTRIGFKFAKVLEVCFAAKFYGGEPIERCTLFGIPTLLDPSITPAAWRSQEHRETMVETLKKEMGTINKEMTPDNVDPGVYADPSLALVMGSQAPRVGLPKSEGELDMFFQLCDRERHNIAAVTHNFVKRHSDTIASKVPTAGPVEVTMDDRMYLNDFWKRNRTIFPTPFQIFRRYCAMPAGGSASESQFSVMGYLLNPRRMGTSPALAQDQTIAKCFFMTLPLGKTLESYETSLGLETGALGADGGGIDLSLGDLDELDDRALTNDIEPRSKVLTRYTVWVDF